MSDTFAAIERIETSLHGLNESKLMIEIEALKTSFAEVFRTSLLVHSKFREFHFLLCGKRHFHKRQFRQGFFSDVKPAPSIAGE